MNVVLTKRSIIESTPLSLIIDFVHELSGYTLMLYQQSRISRYASSF